MYSKEDLDYLNSNKLKLVKSYIIKKNYSSYPKKNIPKNQVISISFSTNNRLSQQGLHVGLPKIQHKLYRPHECLVIVCIFYLL